MPSEKNKQGLVIDWPAFIDSCSKQKRCRYLEMTGKTALCGNPHCFLSIWYLLRYKGEGHHWEDMHFNMQRGCFCFEDMGIFGCCPAREKSDSMCKRAIDDFPRPDTNVKFYHLLK